MIATLLFVAGTFVLLAGIFIWQGLQNIPADPPHKGVLTVWGKRQLIVKDEGLRFFPLYPWYHGFISVKVTKVDQDLSAETVRTPDRVESKVPVAVTWTPGTKNAEGKVSPESLITFLNTGGEAGVKNILEDIIQERLREWASSEDEGPATWEELRASREEAAAVLLKAVLGDQLPHVPSSIPTRILLRYFNDPPKKLMKSDEAEWGANWERVKEVLLEENEDVVKEAIENRRREIALSRQGNGHFKLPQLGIELNRLNIGEIKTLGRVAEAAERQEEERLKQKADEVMIQNLKARLKELMTPPPNGPGFSAEQALETYQTEQGRVTKMISESKFNVAPETRDWLKEVGPTVAAEVTRILRGGRS